MGHALDLKYLQLVVAVAEEGTLTRAGQRLHLTQSALSHQLAELEQRFGIEVFQRQGRRLQLTPLGDRLLGRARTLVNQVAELEADLLNPGRTAQELRLVTQCFTCYHWMPTLLVDFERQHPNVAVSLVVESTRNALEALEAGAVDVAISTEEREIPRYHRNFVFEDELVIALSPNHRLAQQAFIHYADLANERLLLHPPSELDKRWFQEMVNPDGCKPGPRLIQHLPVTDTIIELAAQGFGCALVSRRAAAHAAAQGRVVLRAFAPQPLTRSFFAFSRRDNPKNLPIDKFLAAVQEHCRPIA
jgi:LysR family transcriptional regulator for metE and metH